MLTYTDIGVPLSLHFSPSSLFSLFIIYYLLLLSLSSTLLSFPVFYFPLFSCLISTHLFSSPHNIQILPRGLDMDSTVRSRHPWIGSPLDEKDRPFPSSPLGLSVGIVSIGTDEIFRRPSQ